MMEDALEKLKVLDYENKFAKKKQYLDRTSFVLPGKNPSIQFQCFLEIVSWLIGEISTDPDLFKVTN